MSKKPVAQLQFALGGQIVSKSREAHLIGIHARVHGKHWLIPQADAVREILARAEKAGAA